MDLVEFKEVFRANNTALAEIRARKQSLTGKLYEILATLQDKDDPVARSLLGPDITRLQSQLGRVSPRDQGARDALDALDRKITLLEESVDEVPPLPQNLSRAEELGQLQARHELLRKDLQAALGVSHPLRDPLRVDVGALQTGFLEPIAAGRTEGVDLGRGVALLTRIEQRVALIIADREERSDAERELDQLRKAIGPQVASVVSAQESGAYGEPPLGPTREALRRFNAQRDALKKAEARGALATQTTAWQEMAELLSDISVLVGPTDPDGGDGLGDDGLQHMDPRDPDYANSVTFYGLLAEIGAAPGAAAHALTLTGPDAVPDDVRPSLIRIGELYQTVLTLKKTEPFDYVQGIGVARELLSRIEEAAPRVPTLQGARPRPIPPPSPDEVAVRRRKGALDRRVKQANSMLPRSMRRTLPTIAKAWMAGRDAAQRALSKALDAQDWVGANAALDALEDALDAAEAAVRDHLRERMAALGEDDDDQLIQEAGRLAACCPRILKGMPPERLDALIERLGGEASDDRQRRFVQQALEERYQIRLDGDLGARSGPKLYSLLGKLPPDHVKNNPQLQGIQRSSPSLLGTDARRQDVPGGQVLTLPRTGLLGSTTQTLDQDPDVDESCKLSPDPVPRFDHGTLVEVGRMIEARDGFMARDGGKPAYGGWKKQTVDEVAAQIAEHHGLYGAVAGVGDDAARAYLKAVLGGGKHRAALTAAGLAEADPTGLEDHAATRCAASVRLQGGAGLWAGGASAARSAALAGGRVAFESEAGVWLSYDLAARKQAVASGQFQSPGAWYAELYAVYFLGRLPKAHPLYAHLASLETQTGSG